MPKGRVEPRELTCRKCGRRFVSDQCGKASWNCDDCRPAHKPYVPLRERDPEEWTRRELERQRKAVGRRLKKARDAAQRRREREAGLLRQRAERLAPRVERATEALKAIQAQVGALERQADELAPLPKPAPEPTVLEEAREAAGLVMVAGTLGAIERQALAIVRENRAGRGRLGHAVALLAGAEGLAATREALVRVAAEALAWEMGLPMRVREVRGVDDVEEAA